MPSIAGGLRAGAAIVLLLAGSFSVAPARAATGIEGTAIAGPKVVPGEFAGDLRALPALRLGPVGPNPYRRLLKGPASTKFSLVPAIDAPTSMPSGAHAPMPNAVQNFAGMSFSDLCAGGQCGAGWPPDTNGDVGLNHYIEAVNNAYAIYSKTGTLLASFTENQLWSGAGAPPCTGNSRGDPIVLYDPLADRWILTHFAFTFTGPNPTSPFY